MLIDIDRSFQVSEFNPAVIEVSESLALQTEWRDCKPERITEDPRIVWSADRGFMLNHMKTPPLLRSLWSKHPQIADIEARRAQRRK